MTTACGEKRGTLAGVYRHRRDWDPVCDDCRAAAAAYQRARRAADPEAAVQARRESLIRRRALAVLVRRHRSEFADLLRQVRETS